MSKYMLNVWCRRNGVSCEAGLHATARFKDDDSALSGMKKIAEDELLHHYDEINCKVMRLDGVEETLIGKFNVTKPLRREHNQGDYNGWADV